MDKINKQSNKKVVLAIVALLVIGVVVFVLVSMQERVELPVLYQEEEIFPQNEEIILNLDGEEILINEEILLDPGMEGDIILEPFPGEL